MRFKRSSLLMKILLLVMVVYATVTLVSNQERTTSLRAQVSELQEQIETKREENARLERAISQVQSGEGVEDVAREKLGWASEGEIIFYDVGK